MNLFWQKSIKEPSSHFHFYKALLDQGVVVIGTVSDGEETLNLIYRDGR
ncbi:hypothetical protein ABN702_16080 [Bacillus haimaensis]